MPAIRKYTITRIIAYEVIDVNLLDAVNRVEELERAGTARKRGAALALDSIKVKVVETRAVEG